ncbi:hypothetical protein N0V95_007044 [Ascochyta clinopodiicola]|nr:hypothetical protein N0V95_007044 [Ascochyta clinopodiicola]
MLDQNSPTADIVCLPTESPTLSTQQLPKLSQIETPEESEDHEEPLPSHVGQDEPARITAVPNNNRPPKRAQGLKLDAAQAKKNLELGLIAPPEKAPRKEHGAYASISRQDEPLISWILEQPVDEDNNLYSSAAAPYVTACSMLDKARAIGNATSQASAAAFLRSWRAQGTPFASESVEARPPASSRGCWQLSRRGSPSMISQSALASAWSLCDRYEQELDIIHIKYCWAMAFLSKAYREKMEQIRKQDTALSRDMKNRNGRGKVSSEAMNNLMRSVSATPSLEQRQRFKRRLHQALRWFEVARTLGWGMLCFMPHDIITNSWVENDLRIRYWDIWLKLVAKVNPDAHKASTALDAWLGSEGIAGGSISGKETLSIEADAPVPVMREEEIEDSGIEDSDDDEGDVEPAPSRATARSSGPARPMRQLTLLELCRPQV